MNARLAASTLVLALTAAGQVPASAAEAAEDPAYGWTQLHRRLRPPGSSGAAMAYDAAREEVVLFPGHAHDGGDGGTWLRRGGAWRRTPSVLEPEPRYAAAMAYDAARERMVLFGGYGSSDEGGSRPLGDTWIWDGARWRRVDPPSAPSARAGAAMAYDAVREEIILFGGIGLGESGQAFTTLSDTWTWDGHTWTPRDPEGEIPSARSSAGMSFHAATGEILLFGGTSPVTGGPSCTVAYDFICVRTGLEEPPGDGARDDLWAWDGEAWSARSTETRPPGRSSFGMAYDSARRRTVVFGGGGGGRFLGDTWEWDGTAWQQVASEPGAGNRLAPAMTYDEGLEQVVLYGGNRVTYSASDTWGWDGARWTSLEDLTPRERIESSMAVDPATGEAVLFGGLGDEIYGDTWTHGASWSRREPGASPAARFDAAMTTDLEREEVILFGGMAADGADLADVWRWTSGTWEEVTPAFPSLAPLGRRSTALAFDAGRDEAVLFGGWNVEHGLVLGDTWVWDGAGWEPKVSVSPPPALRDHMMAYDEKHGEVVLYGGVGEDAQTRNETWTWDGDAWELRETSGDPGPRGSGMMAYDPTIERVVLFGGFGGGGRQVWAWDGEDWTDLDITDGPEGASDAAAAFVPSLGGILTFGVGGGARDETWLLRVRPDEGG